MTMGELLELAVGLKKNWLSEPKELSVSAQPLDSIITEVLGFTLTTVSFAGDLAAVNIIRVSIRNSESVPTIRVLPNCTEHLRLYTE